MIIDALAEYVLSHLLDRAKGVLPDSVLKRLDGDTSLRALLERDILPKSLEALVARRPDLQANPDLVEQVIAPAIAHIIQHSVLSGQPGAVTDLQTELDKLLAHDLTFEQRITCAALLADYQQVFYAQLAPHQSAGDALIVQHLAQIRAQVDQLRQMIALLSLSGGADKITRKPRIFISYARADDESFAERLYHALKDDFEVWWDRVSMPNRGLTFLQEIREAIDGCDRLLLVAGPAAFTSEYVRDEWRHAYENYKGINIALRLGNYPDLPDQLGGFDAPDFRDDANYTERLATLWRQLAEPVAPIGELHGVPALPPHFLNRPDALDALRALVIADVDKPTLISAEKRTTAVEGMGGIGKSVVATAFAHDRKVRFAFPDGIVWLTVGRTPSLFELYRAVGVALGDDLRNYPDETTARQNAQKMLAGKKCLIILDDVWELTVARAFRDLISGATTRLLITTRNLQINDLLGASEYRLKLVDRAQAADYLRSWVGDDPDLEKVAQKLGYLFLALKLAGALMKENRLSGAEYLSMFTLVSDMETGDDNLEVSINLGVDAAFARYEDRKLLYHTFGIFQEDIPVPQHTVLQLWSHLRPDVRSVDHLKTLTTLVNLGLAERDDESIITLHDLLHSYTREKLGERYVQTHHDLLESYGVEAWHKLPSDQPYLWRHIAYHLIQGGQPETLYALLTDYRWLQAKLDVTDSKTLIADYDSYLNTPHIVQNAKVEKAKTVRLLKSALTMSEHALNVEKYQWGTQLVGRLMTWRRRNPTIHTLTENIMTNVRGVYPTFPDSDYAVLDQAGDALIRILIGHTGNVTLVALHPDGRRAISASYDQTIRLWDLNTGSLIHTFSGHTDFVTYIALTLDGRRVVSASHYDSTLRIWDIETGALLKNLSYKNRFWLENIVLLPDGRRLISILDETIKVWDIESGVLLHTLKKKHIDSMSQLALVIEGRNLTLFSDHIKVWGIEAAKLLYTVIKSIDAKHLALTPDGKRAIWAISDDPNLYVWDVENDILLYNLTGHASDINYIAVTPNSKRVISASWDKTMRIWNIETGELLHILLGHTEPISYISFSMDGRRAISAAHDKTVKIWDIETGILLHTLTSHTGSVNQVVFTLDNLYAVSVSEDKTVRIWDVQVEAQLEILPPHLSKVNHVLLIPKRQQVISAGWDEIVQVWDIESGMPVKTLTGHTKWVNDVKLSSNGRWLISAAYDHTIRIWDIETGILLHTLSNPAEAIDDIALVVGVGVVYISWNTYLRDWSYWSEVEHYTWIGLRSNATHLILTPDEKRVISASGGTLSRYYNVVVWDIQSGLLLQTLADEMYGVNHIALTQDGQSLVSAWFGGTIKIWKIESDTFIQTRILPDVLSDEIVSQILLTPDGRRMIFASVTDLRRGYGNIQVWDLEAGVLIHTLSGHTRAVWHMALNRDGQRMVSISLDQTLRVWDIEIGIELGVFANTNAGRAEIAKSFPDFIDFWGFQQREGHLLLCDGKQILTSELTFHSDADLTSPQWLIPGQTLIAGDVAGRVMFLRVRK